MAKFKVTAPFVVFVSTEIEAESEQDAIDLAYEEISITRFCGNGGSDKLIGVCEGSIEATEEPYEADGFSITAELVDV